MKRILLFISIMFALIALLAVNSARITVNAQQSADFSRPAQIVDDETPSIDVQKKNGRSLARLIRKAKRESIIEVSAGFYNMSDVKIYKSVKLVGVGNVVFQSEGRVAKGILVPDLGVSLHVENITFRNARSRDRNGAGIRNDGRDLKVINCIFEDNENGILSTGNEKGVVEIINSSFLRNGNGDGFSHAIYLSSGAELLISNSRFMGTKIGHHVKSLAKETHVKNSYFDDTDGRTSYALDVTRGGNASLADSFIMQRETSENSTIVNFDASRGGEALSLRITDNRIVNRHPEGRLLRNDTQIVPMLKGNVITNEGSGILRDGK